MSTETALGPKSRLERGGGRRRVGQVLLLLLLLLLPLVLPRYLQSLAITALVYAIFAMSLDLLLGYTGLSSLGHAAYLGLGAYAVGVLTTRYGAGFWTVLLAGVLLALAVAALFGLVALRATGVYFLMITLALGMTVWGAHGIFAENRRGRIRPGFDADLCVVDKDPLTTPVSELRATRNLMTILAGEIVYRDGF